MIFIVVSNRMQNGIKRRRKKKKSIKHYNIVTIRFTFYMHRKNKFPFDK